MNSRSSDQPDAMVRRRWLPRLRLPFRGSPEVAPKTMALVDHLVELRNRLFICAFSLVPGTIVGYLLSDTIIRILKAPLPDKKPLITLGLTEPFLIHMQVALVFGLIVAMPVLLFQLWRFISPGLTPQERSTARPWVPLALLFFMLGVALAYSILPVAAGFLYGFQTEDIQLMLTAEAYFGFITLLFLVFGLVMEFPIILVLLAKVGMISSQQLRRSRRTAVLGIVVVSYAITPGADLVSPTVLAVTMYVLYEFSIILIRLNGR